MISYRLSKCFSTCSIFAIVILGSLLVSCASTKLDSDDKTATTNLTIKEDESAPHDWGTILRRVPGLKISGSYPDLSIIMRGAKSVSRTSEPLYVLDGVPLGRSFRELASTADPSNIKRIRVLKGPEAAKYGMRGANGVIEVNLKG